jgi:hypothetical protein
MRPAALPTPTELSWYDPSDPPRNGTARRTFAVPVETQFGLSAEEVDGSLYGAVVSSSGGGGEQLYGVAVPSSES